MTPSEYLQNFPQECASPSSSNGSSSSNDSLSNFEKSIDSDFDKPATSSVSSKSNKEYPCTFCSKIFNRPSALKTHVYSHTSEKPFQCLSPGCGRKFSVVSNLRRHFKIHQREYLEINDHTKITAKERVQRVRQLISKKYDPRLNLDSHYHHYTIPTLRQPVSESTLQYSSHSQQNHYLLLPPILAENRFYSAVPHSALPPPPTTVKGNEYQPIKNNSFTDTIPSAIAKEVYGSDTVMEESSLLAEHDFPYFWENQTFIQDSSLISTVLSGDAKTNSSGNQQYELFSDTYHNPCYL